MRKISIIFLMGIYLLSATELSQFLKLPLLIEHIVAHKKNDSKISIWTFLYIHYGQGNVVDSDFKDDMKLPFKMENNTVGLTNAAYFPLIASFTVLKPAPFVVINTFNTTEHPLLSGHFSNIWQPPKVC